MEAPTANVILWCNMTTMGVVPLSKLEWVLAQATSMLQEYPTVGSAEVLLPNLSSSNDLATPSERASASLQVTKDEEEAEGGSGTSDESSAGSDTGADPDSELRAIQHDVGVRFS